jgi:hypothetical protein
LLQAWWVLALFAVPLTGLAAAADAAGNAERARRRITRDDPAVLAVRARGYASVRAQVESAVAGPDAVKVRDYVYLPLALWRLSSADALNQMRWHPSVRRIDPVMTYHPVSVSDLPFISQPQTAADGAIGAGNTVDAPLPMWAYFALGACLLAVANRRELARDRS